MNKQFKQVRRCIVNFYIILTVMKKNILGSVLALLPSLSPLLFTRVFSGIIQGGVEGVTGADASGQDKTALILIVVNIVLAVLGIILMNIKGRSFLRVLGGILVGISFACPLLGVIARGLWIPIVSIVAGIFGLVLLAKK